MHCPYQSFRERTFRITWGPMGGRDSYCELSALSPWSRKQSPRSLNGRTTILFPEHSILSVAKDR